MVVAVVVQGWAQELETKERDLAEPVVFGVSEVFYPYSFLDTNGEVAGFAVDLSTAVAETMGLNVRRVALANTQVSAALREGQIDVVQFWSETPARHAFCDFSVPIVRFETVVVARKDNAAIRTLADLRGKRVAVGQKGTVGERYMLEQNREAVLVYTETSDEFLRMVDAGDCDAAVMSRLTAVSMIDRLGLRNLGVIEDRIKGYDVRYCFAVRRGEALLLARLNEGLAILHRTERYDEIYRKWFGRYEGSTYSTVQLVSWVAGALALGCILACIGFFRQRKLVRRIAGQAAELSEQRSLLAALHENHPLATVILDVSAEGGAKFVSSNGEAGRLFGLERNNVAGRRLGELALSAEVRAYFEDVAKRWTASPQAGSFEARLSASQRTLETELVPISPEGSGASRVCVLSADVTKRRWMDLEIARSRRLRALGELVGGIAHEFNNLLTPIIATTGALQADSRAQPVIATGLGAIEQAARQASELTRRLLTFGRKSDEKAQPVRIADAVANCSALLKPTVDRRIEWEVVVPAQLAAIMFNPVDLNQIVLNLVLNARDTLVDKLSVRGGDAGWAPRLRVSIDELPAAAHARRGAENVRELLAWQRLTVEDNGLGISSEVIDRIFEPFFTTKDVGKGSGLGLATVWHVTTDGGGHVSVESKLGVGTKIHVAFPRWREEEARIEVKPRAAKAAVMPASCRILMAEDEAIVAHTLSALLRKLGHSVTHKPDGAEAWEHFSTGEQAADFDALLVDVNMPRMNGVDLVRRVRTTAFAGRIVVMSGRVADEDMQALKELGVDRVLTKPFTMDELSAVLRS